MERTDPNVKNQHYVWRSYLDAWASTGTFCCYRQKDRNLFSTQPKVIASETYFYEIQELTDADKQFVEDWIARVKLKELQKLNREFVDLTQLTFTFERQLANEALAPDERKHLEGKLLWAKRNLIEQYHSGVEDRAQPMLASLRAGDDSFLGDDERRTDFVHFLLMQYFRTAKMREAQGAVPTYIADHDPQRTATILAHIHAINVGASLFGDGKARRVIFLKNDSPIPFIVGDQPVINLLDLKATDDVDLYYPLSPRLAIIFSKDAAKYPDKERRVTGLEVENYNYAIYRKSRDQVYSNDADYLKKLVAIGKGVLES